MARAKKPPTADVSADLYEWAAAVLQLRFDEAMSYADAVLVSGDVDAVHDMRVAIRRLRTALGDFAGVINEKPLKRVKDDLKKIADSLGTARDQDVAILSLEEFAAEAENASIRTGIEEMIGKLRRKRKRALSQSQKNLEPVSLDKLRERFSTRIADSISQRELFGSPNLRDVTKTVIGVRLQKFHEMGRSIYHPLDAQKVHDLRIAAKRLRYSIELFAGFCGDEISGFAPELAKLQTFLGDVHDCDVWTGTLKKGFKAKARSGPSSATSAWLLSKFVGKRSKAYRSALELWRWMGSECFFPNAACSDQMISVICELS